MPSPKKIEKSEIIKAIQVAHENEKRRALDAADNFRDSKTFPDAAPAELAKVSRIEKILATLQSYSAKHIQDATQVKEAYVLIASSTQSGLQYYFFTPQTECPFVEIDKDIKVRVISPEGFEPSTVGKVYNYEQGRPGEKFEVQVKALEIY